MKIFNIYNYLITYLQLTLHADLTTSWGVQPSIIRLSQQWLKDKYEQRVKLQNKYKKGMKDIQNVRLYCAGLTSGTPRPFCLSIISALARMIFPPWVFMVWLSQDTKSGRFNSFKKENDLFICKEESKQIKNKKSFWKHCWSFTTYFCRCLRPITWETISARLAVRLHNLQVYLGPSCGSKLATSSKKLKPKIENVKSQNIRKYYY